MIKQKATRIFLHIAEQQFGITKTEFSLSSGCRLQQNYTYYKNSTDKDDVYSWPFFAYQNLSLLVVREQFTSLTI